MFKIAVLAKGSIDGQRFLVVTCHSKWLVKAYLTAVSNRYTVQYCSLNETEITGLVV